VPPSVPTRRSSDLRLGTHQNCYKCIGHGPILHKKIEAVKLQHDPCCCKRRDGLHGPARCVIGNQVTHVGSTRRCSESAPPAPASTAVNAGAPLPVRSSG